MVSVQGEEAAETGLHAYLDGCFEKAVESEKEYLREAMRAAREHYFASEGLGLLSQFLESGDALFELPIKVEELATSEQDEFKSEWSRFTRMYAQNPAAGKQALESEIEEMWKVEEQKIPSYIPEASREDVRRNWLPSSICTIVRHVVEERLHAPPVKFSHMNANDQQEAKAAWKEYLAHTSATADPVGHLQKNIKEEWALEKKNLPSYMDETTLLGAEEKWLLKNFTPLLKNVLGLRCALTEENLMDAAPSEGGVGKAKVAGTGSAGESKKPTESLSSSSVLSQTRRSGSASAGDTETRRPSGEESNSSSAVESRAQTRVITVDSGRRLRRRTATSAETTFVSCLDLNTGKVDLSQKLGLCVCVLQWPYGNDENTKKGLNVIFADQTGIMQGTAWGTAKVELVQHQGDDEADGEAEERWMSVEGFKVTESGTTFPGMKSLSLTQGCTITRIEQPNGAFVFPVSPTAYKVSFGDFSTKTLPFTTSFRGVICDLSGTSATEQGQNILSFKVQDQEADVMKVLAIGRYADEDFMKVGVDIVVYFAKAQKSKKAGQASVMWLFSDAYVHVAAEGARVAPCRREICLQEA